MLDPTNTLPVIGRLFRADTRIPGRVKANKDLHHVFDQNNSSEASDPATVAGRRLQLLGARLS